MKLLAWLSLGLWFTVVPCWAQVVVTDHALALTTSPVNCVAPISTAKTLSIQAPDTNTTDVLYCYRSSPPTPCTPNSWRIQPGQTFWWITGTAPVNGMDCAMASSTGNVYVGQGQ
jgi:hypothetical protein